MSEGFNTLSRKHCLGMKESSLSLITVYALSQIGIVASWPIGCQWWSKLTSQMELFQCSVL